MNLYPFFVIVVRPNGRGDPVELWHTFDERSEAEAYAKAQGYEFFTILEVGEKTCTTLTDISGL